MKQWIVRKISGETQGPFDEEEIYQKIEALEFVGEELITDPNAVMKKWIPLSTHPPFREALLKASKEKNESSFEEVELQTHSSGEKQEIKRKPRSLFGKILLWIKRRSAKEISKPDEETGRFKGVRIQRKTSSVIEMEDAKSVRSKYIVKNFLIPVGVLGGVFYLFVLYLNHQPSQEGVPDAEDRIQLLLPRSGGPPQNLEQAQAKIEKGLSFYFIGQVSDFIRAQKEFVQVIEGNPRHKLAHAYLCLVYFELWPFTHRRSDDLQILSTLVEKVKKIDAGGVYSSLCHSVYLALQEQYEMAENLIRNSIDMVQGSETERDLAPFLYYLRGSIRFYQLKMSLSLQDLENAQALLPEMNSITLAQAQIFEKRNQFNQALKIYSQITQSHPRHKTALLAQGILQYNYLRQFDQAEKMIRNAVEIPGLVSPKYLSEAYFILAQIALKIKDSSEFLKYGKKAYALNPANAELEELLKNVSDSQQEKIKETQVKSRLLIEQGDQLEREGDILSARSYYEKAFIVDQQKNAIAALKMGRNLWESGFPLEAIQWLQKAIYADTQYIRPYILMSEYYSELYKMEEAAQILQVAFKKSPNNIDIFKGYANLSLKEKAFSFALEYSKKALQIYELDVESYLLLSKAEYFLGRFMDSFSSVSKARELSMHDRNVNIHYGKVLGQMKGVDVAFEYFEDLIVKTQVGSQNHTQYVLALGEFLLDHEEYRNAVNVLEALSGLSKKPIQYYILIGKIYSKMEMNSQAYEEFLNAALINPGDPQVMYQLGYILMKLKKYSEAESYFNRILKSYERYPEINYWIAHILFLKDGEKNLRSAVKNLNQEIKVNSKFAKAHSLLGDIHEKLNEYRLCARAYQKAFEFVSDGTSYSLKSASCYKKAGDIDLALQILRGEIDSNKGNAHPLVYRDLGEIYEMKREYSEATKSYARYINMVPDAEDRKQIEGRVNSFGN